MYLRSNDWGAGQQNSPALRRTGGLLVKKSPCLEQGLDHATRCARAFSSKADDILWGQVFWLSA